MATKRLEKRRKAGRPPTLTMPEPIDDTIENVMDAALTTPPKKRSEWKYLQKHKASSSRRHAAMQEGSI